MFDHMREDIKNIRGKIPAPASVVSIWLSMDVE